MASKAKTGRDDEATSAVELTEATESAVARTDGDSTTDTASKLGHHSFLSRLYTGTGAFEVVGRRRLWFGVSGAIVAVAIASIVFRGFTFGIDFKGGTTVSFPRGSTQVAQVEDVYYRALGSEPQSVVIVGAGASATVQIRSETLTSDQTAKLRDALFEAFGPKGTDGQPSKQAISDSAVSETWGGQITKKAVIALVVFLVLVALYITVRYERYMTISAITAMLFDLTVTAGVYSLVGFEVTPATVIGLLTILGFSLYDTVIVFDKVEENTHGFQHTTRRTFAEQANLAINQTFMRSINTSLIGVLPVLALMVVAVWLLGVGTLKDLALVQLIGIIIGTYSSIFFATPLLVTLRERTELVRNHTRRVLKRRNSGSPAGSEDASTDGGEQPAAADEQSLVGITQASSQSAPRAAQGSSKPAPGGAQCVPSVPGVRYRLTAAGRAKLDHSYDDLASAAMRQLREIGGEEAVRTFARRRIDAILADVAPADGPDDAALEAAAERIATALSKAGYVATTTRVGGPIHGVQICQHHCPVSHVAEEFPELCETEQQAMAEVLGTHVQRLATIVNGDCACTTHVPLSPAPSPRPPATSTEGASR